MATSTVKIQQEGRQVSKEEPCPLCGGEYRCFLLSDDCVVCGGMDIAPAGWRRVKASKDGRGIFSRGSGKGSGKRSQKAKSKPKIELPVPNEILPLVVCPQTDSPEWVTLATLGSESEIEIEYLYPNLLTGESLGKVVRRQWTDRRSVYRDKAGKLHNKLIQPWHWAEPYHPDQSGKGWWSDRGKGSKTWPLYCESEVGAEIAATGGDSVVFYVAGEQAVETARQVGLLALTNQGGEGSYQQQVVEFLSTNKPKLFVIWPDNDSTGRTSSARLLKACLEAGIPSIVIEPIAIWPDILEKGDIKNVVKDSGMGVPELIRRLELEIHRALDSDSSGNDTSSTGSDDNGGDDGNNRQDTDQVVKKTVEQHIFDTLFESGTGKTCTIEDTFYADTGLGHWKRVPDKPVLKAIAHKLKSAYTLVYVEEQPVKDYPFFTHAKAKSTFLICRDALDVGMLPANNHLRCFTNCTVDLRTGEAIPHDPAHFLTTAIAAEYHPGQECPEVFLEFIKSAYGEELVEVVRAYTSMLLDPTAPYGKFIHLMGPSGSGKGTLLRLWGELFGNDHFRSGEFSNLSTSEGRHQYLTGAALYSVPDVGGYVQGLKPFYELVDNGPMTGRALFSPNAYQRLWNCRYVVASVDHLQIENSGDGWERRCLPLPTKARAGIEDPNLGCKLAEVKGAIISWALSMPREDRDRLILHPSTNERVLNLKHDAAIHGDPVRAFVDMCLRPASNAEATLESHQLHSWFGAFCQQHGYQGWGMSKFANHLKTIIPSHYVARRRASATEDPERPMLPAHWNGIAKLPGVFIDIAEQQAEAYQSQSSQTREAQWACIKSKCLEGGLMALKNGSPGSPGSVTTQKVGDPPETTLDQYFQKNGSPGSPGSQGGGVEQNAIYENSTRIDEKVERINVTSTPPLADPADPNSESPSGTGFNTDHPPEKGVSDPSDPSDPLQKPQTLVDDSEANLEDDFMKAAKEAIAFQESQPEVARQSELDLSAAEKNGSTSEEVVKVFFNGEWVEALLLQEPNNHPDPTLRITGWIARILTTGFERHFWSASEIRRGAPSTQLD